MGRIFFLIILSIFLMNFIHGDKLAAGPITGKDIVSGVNQPVDVITESNANKNPGNPANVSMQGILQEFIGNNWKTLLIGIIIMIIIIILILIILKKQKGYALSGV